MPNPRPRLIPLLLSVLTLVGMLLSASCADHHAAGAPPASGFELVVESPSEGQTLATPSLEVRGRVSAAGAVVAINAETVVVDTSGRFQKAFTLKPGTTTFTIDAWRSAPGTGVPPDVRVVRTVSFAWPTLAITVSSPAEGAVLRTNRVQVAGSVSEPTAQLTLNERAVTLDPTGAFSLPWELPVGASTLRFQATTGDGRTATATRTVTVQDTSGLLKLTEPIEGLVTNAATLRVQGTVQDVPTRLVVQGQALTAAAGPFSLTLTPDEGPVRIVAEATFADGATAMDSRNVRIDRTPPVITLIPEPPALTNRKTLTLTGTVADATATVLMLGDTPLPLDAQGRFSRSVDLLEEGTRMLPFRAVDAAGNVGTLERAVVRDTIPPEITLDAPLPTTTSATSLPVSGRIRDPHGILLASLNGTALTLEGDGHFQATWTLVTGSNTLHISATDGAGNVGGFQHTITTTGGGDPEPLLLLGIDSPAQGAIFISTPIPVTGTVSEAGASVSVNGNPLTVVGTTVSGTVGLNTGSNRLVFTAQKGTRSTTVTRQVTLGSSGSALSLQVMSPADGAITNALQLNVTGYVSDPGAVVRVNDAKAVVDELGSFTVQLAPPEGAFLIRVEASNTKHESVMVELGVMIDRTAPIVRLRNPEEGLITRQGLVHIAGTVDDPEARLLVFGQSITPDASGAFQTDLNLPEGGHVVVVMATDTAGNTGHAVRSLTVDATPPLLAWIEPTPGENALWTSKTLEAVATVSEMAIVKLNGASVSVKEQELAGAGPFVARGLLTPAEGMLELVLEATDRAGNTARITRRLEVGLTAPELTIDAPSEGLTTQDGSVPVSGRVASPAPPLLLRLNGRLVPVGTDGRFSTTTALSEGRNALNLEVEDRFGLKGKDARTVFRYTAGVQVSLDWPLEGLAVTQLSTRVAGRANRPVQSVLVNGIAATVSEDRRSFTAQVPLVSGTNRIIAAAQDQAGNSGEASVTVTQVGDSDPASLVHWETPVADSRSATREIKVKGTVDLPATASIQVNGRPMVLRVEGTVGIFEGVVELGGRGPNAVILEATTLSGRTCAITRDVIYAPEMPRVVLTVPEAARPGDRVTITVQAEPGTVLSTVDVSWNGQVLAHLTPPFPSVEAVVPTDAAPGSRIRVEALAQDLNQESVTARAYVVVGGLAGSALVQAFDDRTGQALADVILNAPGLMTKTTDATGRAILTCVPTSWIQAQKAGYTPQWRSAALRVAGGDGLFGHRLTPLVEAQEAAPTVTFSGGAELHLAASASGKVSLTPLTTQGLPALLPAGWSAVSAWWYQSDTPQAGASLRLTLPRAVLGLADLAWVRWDTSTLRWTGLAASLDGAGSMDLGLPYEGGYALVVPDPAPTKPPAAVVGVPLSGYVGTEWRDGLKARGGVEPSAMATVEALRGTRALATFSVEFEGHDPLPSGRPIQMDLLETYTLVDQSLIEPERRTHDGVITRWVLGVDKEARPTVRQETDGLALEFPVRMTRTFAETELAEGRIQVGFYHDGMRVAQGGSVLIGTEGGQATRDGVTVTVAPAAGTVLIRLYADPDPAVLWPDLATRGAVLKSFQLDMVGALSAGIGLSFQDLVVGEGLRPILVQERSVLGELQRLAIGELIKEGSLWRLLLPSGGSAPRVGGGFAVWVPGTAWDWVSGTVTVPRALAQQIPNPGNLDNVPCADAVIRSGLLPAVSDDRGTFASPATGVSVNLVAARKDLGLEGSAAFPVPASNVSLKLDATAFRLMAFWPAAGSKVDPGAVVEILTSAPIEPTSLADLKLIQESTAAPAFRLLRHMELSGDLPGGQGPKARPAAAFEPVERSIRRNLSADGRHLTLVPEQALESGASYRVVIENLKSKAGATLERTERSFGINPALGGEVDLSRIVLGYPTASGDVSITVPSGAIPPWSMMEFSAERMGSVAMGVMPPSGPQGFTLRAELGERIRVSVTTRDGRSGMGWIGRYVAPDGRTTLGVEGGRIEGPRGLAVTIPAGALTGTAEFQIEPLDTPIDLPEGELEDQESLMPLMNLKVTGAIELKKPPVIEMPRALLGENAEVVPNPQDAGNGPVGVFRKERRLQADGSTDEILVLMDTAALAADGLILRTLGGFRDLNPVTGGARVHEYRMPLVPIRAPQRDAIRPPGVEASVMVSGMLNELYILTIPAGPRPVLRLVQGMVTRNWNGTTFPGGLPSGSAGRLDRESYNPMPFGEVYRRKPKLANGQATWPRNRLAAIGDEQGFWMMYTAGLSDQNAPPPSLDGLDPRTGESSTDHPERNAAALGHVNVRHDVRLLITSAENPFDTSYNEPRLRVKMVDQTGSPVTLVPVGDTVSLHIELEPSSTPTARGKVSGDMEASFGPLSPASSTGVTLPVTMTKEGPWKVSVQAWSTPRGVQTTTTCEIVVTPKGQLGPAVPGAPRIIKRSPENEDRDVEPSSTIRVTFSEPVTGVRPSAFSLSTGGQALPFRLVAQGREISSGDPGTSPAQEIWLMPLSRLPLGKRIDVSASSTLVDSEGEGLRAGAWYFTVREAEELGSLATTGNYTHMVSHKGLIYASEIQGFATDATTPVEMVRVFDAKDPSALKKGIAFGGYGMWEDPARPDLKEPMYVGNSICLSKPFYKQFITGLSVARGVGVDPTNPRDLLLVVTQPWKLVEETAWAASGENWYATEWGSRHHTLWAFDITGDAQSLGPMKEPKPVFAISLGTESQGSGVAAGNIGGLIGVIRRRAGWSIWTAQGIRDGFNTSAATASQGATNPAPWATYGHVITAWKATYFTGHFPPSQTLMVSNGLGKEDGVGPIIISGALGDDDASKPVGVCIGLGSGVQPNTAYVIESRVDSPGVSTATYIPGGSEGLDGRMKPMNAFIDLVQGEQPMNVELLRGQWTGNGGQETGLLALVATDKNLRVVKINGSGTNYGFPVLGVGSLGGRKPVHVQIDAANMLVAVRVKGPGNTLTEIVFDLKDLTGTNGGMPPTPRPKDLLPLVEIPVGQNVSALFDGKLAVFDDLDPTNLRIVNIDAVTIEPYSGVPALVPSSVFTQGALELYDTEGMPAQLFARTRAEAAATPVDYVYAMAKLESGNNGYRWLRYYYPELGDIQLSSIINTNNQALMDQVRRDPKAWQVKIQASLVQQGSSRAPVTIPVTLLNILGSDVVPIPSSDPAPKGDIRTDGEPNRIMILSGLNEGPRPLPLPLNRRFMYVPFKFSIPTDVMQSLESDLRQDMNNSWRIKIKSTLMKREGSDYLEQPARSELEFIVKFNSNTTLFDVARGGVWHFDPQLSGGNPDNTTPNAATVQVVNGSQTLVPRLSITPEIYRDANGQALDPRREVMNVAKLPSTLQPLLPAFDGSMARFNLKDAKLDVVQLYLDKALRGLRRKWDGSNVDVQDNPAGGYQIEYVADRQSIFNWTPESLADAGTVPEQVAQAGDGLGAYAYKTLQMVNAVQWFTNAEAQGTGRDMNAPINWAVDPAVSVDEKAPDGNPMKIIPALRQQLMAGNTTRFNADAILFHYVAAYGSLRSPQVIQGKTYPVSSLLTRELVFGPSKSIPGHMSWQRPDDPSQSQGLYAQRDAIDKLLEKIRQAEHRDAAEVAFKQLAGELEAQDIITMRSDLSTELFNPGIGILALALSKSWYRYPQETADTTRPGNLTKQQLFIAEKPDTFDYKNDRDFNATYYNRIVDFLCGDSPEDGTYRDSGNFKTERIDILINGVATPATAHFAYMEKAQEELTAQEKANGAAWTSIPGMKAPFIAVYNVSKKKRRGSFVDMRRSLVTYLDAAELVKDIFTNYDTDLRDGFFTFNPDSIRLIGVLRATVQALRSDRFKTKYFPMKMDINAVPGQVWNLNLNRKESVLSYLVETSRDLHLYPQTNDPRDNLNAKRLTPVIRVPDPLDPSQTIETGDPDPDHQNALKGQILVEAKRLNVLIDNYPIVLNAHSQGAAKSAIAMHRLGSVETIRGNRLPVMEVAPMFHFITYGAAANMTTFTFRGVPDPNRFISYTHHINQQDPAGIIGMGKYNPLNWLYYAEWTQDHHIAYHRRRIFSERTWFFSFKNHRFWTYACQIPSTKDLPGLKNAPPVIAADVAKEMCEAPIR